MKLVGPKEYDFYLKHLYGNYMQLPPENERNVHAEEFVEE
jgi:lipopolysaccharide cholinephosphotransferase